MARPPIVHRDEAWAVLYVRVPGWLKNRVVEAAGREGQSVTSWVANVVLRAVEDGGGVPPPPPAVAPVPDVGDVLRSYITGERLVAPCGKVAPCELMSEGTTTMGDMEYCAHCGIRVV